MVQFSNLQPSSCFRDVLLMKTHRPLREDPRKQAFFDYSKATAKYKEKTWLLDDVGSGDGGDTGDCGPTAEFEVASLLNIDAVTYRRDKHEANAMLERVLEKALLQDTPPAQNPINAPGEWDYFLSHGQGAAGDQVNTLALLLVQRGKRVWYDMNMSDRSTAAMLEGVKHCANFLLFLSGDRGFQDAQETDEIDKDDFWTRYQRTAGEELGAGAQGSVFAAVDTKLQRSVAIKIFKPRNADTLVFTDLEQKRLLREANATIRVSHSNVVTCYEWVLDPKKHEFRHVLELVLGPTLQEMLQAAGGGRHAALQAPCSCSLCADSRALA